MTKAQLAKRFKEIFQADFNLMLAKNHDYADQEDALYNLRRFGFYGIVVRLSDKFSRLEQFAKSGSLKIKGEGVRDTLRDIRIYSTLAEVLFDEENK